MTSRKVDMTIPNVPWPTPARGLVLGADGNLPGGLVDGKVDKNSVVVAATRIVQSKLLASDAQPAFRILGDGKHEWGPGGATAPDTNLYRAAAGQLATNGFFFAQVTAGLAALGARRSGDSGWRFYIGSDGDLVWGLAAGSYDTYLRRSAAGTLRVNSVLDVEQHIFAAGGTAQQITLHSNGQIYLGNAFDTWIYRKAGNKVGTIGSWTAEGAVTGWGFEAYGSGEAQPRAMLRNDAMLLFGPGGSSAMDTSLYRSGANYLRTNGTLQVGSDAGHGIHFLASAPTNNVVMTGKMIGGALGALITALEVKIDGSSYRIPVYV